MMVLVVMLLMLRVTVFVPVMMLTSMMVLT